MSITWKVARRVVAVAWLLPLLSLVPAWLVPWNYVHMRENASAIHEIAALLISGCAMIAAVVIALSVTAISLALVRDPAIDLDLRREP